MSDETKMQAEQDAATVERFREALTWMPKFRNEIDIALDYVSRRDETRNLIEIGRAALRAIDHKDAEIARLRELLEGVPEILEIAADNEIALTEMTVPLKMPRAEAEATELRTKAAAIRAALEESDGK